MQATILHLNERIDCLEFKETQLSESKGREEQLSQQIKLLSEQLLRSQAHHTPVSSQAHHTPVSSQSTQVTSVSFLTQRFFAVN